MRLLNQLHLKWRLIISFLVLGLIPMIGIAVIAFMQSKNSLETAAKEQLTMLKETKASQLETMYEDIHKQAAALAFSTETIEALESFSSSYQDYVGEVGLKIPRGELEARVEKYYRDQFKAEFSRKNGDAPFDEKKWIKNLSDAGLALQYAYISENTNPLGSKHKLDAAGDETRYSKTHLKYHPTFRNFVETFGYYDLFLVDANGNVVYTNYKELDFATNLKTGSWAETDLGTVFAQTIRNDSFLTDLKAYRPSYDAPAQFVAHAIFKNKVKIGAVILQIPVDRINIILSNNQRWKETGFGETGDVYVVGQDSALRSIMRKFVEDRPNYMNALGVQGLGTAERSKIEFQGTPALYVNMKTDAVIGAHNGRSDTIFQKAIDGSDAIASFRPLKIDGLQWSIIAETSTAETLKSVYSLANTMTVVVVASLALIGLFAWIFAKQISQSLTGFIVDLRQVSMETSKCSSSLREGAVEVSSSADEQAAAIQETVATLNEMTAMANRSVENVKRSMEKAQMSEAIAKEGKDAVNQMVMAMTDINSSNSAIEAKMQESNKNIFNVIDVINQIAEKTKVINDIVFQTKLLSFNASVEAARAGEHGKGFAVVAQEVGNLAQVSGKAAQEIEQMLTASVQQVEKVVQDSTQAIQGLMEASKEKVDTGLETAKRCEDVLSEVVVNVQDVRVLMNDITAASEEQATGVTNINIAMGQLDKSTSINSTTAQETSRQSEVLSSQGSALMDVVTGIENQIFGAGKKAA